MKYVIDHDFHIHSQLSPCSNDPEQNKYTLLTYAEQKGLSNICVTDHFWDESVPCAANTWEGFKNVERILPLPQSEKVNFHFGCECDMDRYGIIGIDRKNFDRFDFIIVPITHIHLGFARVQPKGVRDNPEIATVITQHFYSLLQSDLPFHKTGLAHFTWLPLDNIPDRDSRADRCEIYDMISDKTLKTLFTRAADLGLGIELNENFASLTEEEKPHILRPYEIARDCGCRFYCGSDAHHPSDLEKATEKANSMVNALNLTEDQKFRPFSK